MSASKEWLKEVHVYSSDLISGENFLSKCRIEYAWNPSKCSHCKVYGHKDSNCGILLANQIKEIKSNNKMEENKEGVRVDLMEILMANSKKAELDAEGFQTVSKNNKGNGAGEIPRTESAQVNQNMRQGLNGKFPSNGKNWNGFGSGNQGIRKNIINKSGFVNGENQGNKGKGRQGYNGKS